MVAAMRGHLRDVLVFIVVAAALMGLADMLFMSGQEARNIRAGKPSPYVQSEPAPVVLPEAPPPAQTPVVPPPEPAIILSDDFDVFDFFNEDMWAEPDAPPSAAPVIEAVPAPAAVPVVPAPSAMGRPRIAIVIDDIGMNMEWSKAAIDLPAPITMAILPYAQQAADFAKRSKEKGHEVLIHTPMEAMHAPVSLGGMGLTTDMGEAEVIAMMELIGTRMEGYIGINNHMGSKFTADRAAMERLMPYLKQRGLAFIDSRTIGSSVAATVAAEQGVPTATRDVFLDHEETTAFVTQALAQAERVARKQGHAIAIGHPKAVTINGLRAWIPTLKDKGIDLVPVSDLLSVKAGEKKKAPEPVTVSAPAPDAPETAPDLPQTEQLLLYSPSPETRF